MNNNSNSQIVNYLTPHIVKAINIMEIDMPYVYITKLLTENKSGNIKRCHVYLPPLMSLNEVCLTGHAGYVDRYGEYIIIPKYGFFTKKKFKKLGLKTLEYIKLNDAELLFYAMHELRHIWHAHHYSDQEWYAINNSLDGINLPFKELEANAFACAYLFSYTDYNLSMMTGASLDLSFSVFQNKLKTKYLAEYIAQTYGLNSYHWRE